MTFSIRVVPSTVSPSCGTKAEIVLGDHRETCPLITTRWSVNDYQRQWHGALESLVAENISACMLITDFRPPKDSAAIFYWALFKIGEQVYIQERFMRIAPEESLLFQPEKLETLIPPRIQGTEEEQQLVSEWVIPLSDLAIFLQEHADC